MRVLKILAVLLIVAVLGVTGYAYLGDMDASPQQVRVPVDLGDGATLTPAAAMPDDTAAVSPAAPAPATPAATPGVEGGANALD